jgi:hypothetical protein
MTRRCLYSGLIIAGIALFLFLSCGVKNVQKINDNDEITEGWINDDAYQIAAGGLPINSLKMIDQRKESARLDAILNARCQIIEKFCGIKIKREDIDHIEDLKGFPIPEELKEILKAGIVKKTVWDKEDNCEIMYEVKGQGLKKKTGERLWK